MNLAICILNIIGTFLLSVEAIKIENLKKLTLLLGKSKSKLNPKIELVDVDKAQSFKEKFGCFIFLVIILLVVGPISYVIIKSLFSNLKIYWLVPLAVFGAFIIWTSLIYFIDLNIKFLALIESYTSKGFIGIAGFMILVTSFILQYKVATP